MYSSKDNMVIKKKKKKGVLYILLKPSGTYTILQVDNMSSCTFLAHVNFVSSFIFGVIWKPALYTSAPYVC